MECTTTTQFPPTLPPTTRKQRWPSTSSHHFNILLPRSLRRISNLSRQAAHFPVDSRHRRSVDGILATTATPSIVLGPTLRILEVSDSFLDLSKLGRSECIGLDIYFLPSLAVPAPDISSLRRAITEAEESYTSRTLQNVSAFGGLYTCSLWVDPVFDKNNSLLYVVLQARDLTTRLTSEPLEVDFDSEAKGWKEDETIGKYISTFHSSGYRLESCSREKGLHYPNDQDCGNDDTKSWAKRAISSVFLSGSATRITKVARDITHPKESQIGSYHRTARMEPNFLESLGHEIRTPMHGIATALTLLHDSGLTTEQIGLAKIVEESGSALLNVINNILDFARIIDGSFTLNAVPFDLHSVYGHCSNHFTSLLKPGVELKVHVSGDIPGAVKGDYVRYRQILANLMTNAARFTKEGSISVHADLLHEDDSHVFVSTEVVDTSAGIPSDVVPSLFEPFSQLYDSRSSYQGAGLGLAVSKILAGKMGGDMGYSQNHDGQGSTFWFSIKLEKVPQSDKGTKRKHSLQSNPMETIKELGPHKSILLVEDNMVNQVVMLRLLRTLGFGRVDTARDGAQAVEMVGSGKGTYDVILMDIDMPVMDGVAATKKIRLDLQNDTPIVALTANGFNGAAEEYISSGMTAYISKPVDRTRLLQIMAQLIE